MAEWSTVEFEKLRQQGDDPADELVRCLREQHDLGEVQRLLASLVENDDPPSERLPQAVRDYLKDSLELDPKAQRDVDAAEDFFGRYGPEIMLVLCCSSLPFDYANKRAVPVLYQTGFLSERPNLRVAQTAQMIVDVMSPDGLERTGRGVRSAQKVRLMHAAVRSMILTDPSVAWDKETLGVPINQADLLYTLMSFTVIVLQGLRRLELPYSQQHAESYYDSWRIVGKLMGIRPELIPENLPEAAQLTEWFAKHEHGPSEPGRVMTRALSGLVGEVLGPFSWFRHSLLRFFIGKSLAADLGVPRRFGLDELVSVVSVLARLLDALPGRSVAGRSAFRMVSLALMQLFIDVEVGGKGRSFRIPTRLREDWRSR